MKHNLSIALLCSLCLLCSCRPAQQKQYTIGVSQCSDDAWRQRMNRELQTELLFHPDLTLRTRHAGGVSAVQCAQIDSFIAEQIDLLIVCPNEAVEVQQAVTRAYQAGIPVVVADRRVSGSQWTAYVGGDNLQVGRELGKWVHRYQERRQQNLRVLEVIGLPGSTPASARHRGMASEISSHPEISVRSVCGCWFTQPAFHAVDSFLTQEYLPDLIVAQNDLMAIGAAQACNKHNLSIPILGVDAIPGQGGGLEAILNGDITASAYYPSRGDLVLQRASAILHGRDFPRETHLKTFWVESDMALAIQEMQEVLDTKIEEVGSLDQKIRTLSRQYDLQQLLVYALCGLTLMLCCMLVGGYLVARYRTRIKKERAEREAEMRRQQEQLDRMTEELKQTKAVQPESERFMAMLQQEIKRRLDDPTLDVESLSSTLGVSRTVLFRKTKNATGQSPIELIHHIRLHKAKELLEKTDLPVQQVAYSVGFSTAGYFTKLYKAEFGTLPRGKQKNTQQQSES